AAASGTWRSSGRSIPSRKTGTARCDRLYNRAALGPPEGGHYLKRRIPMIRTRIAVVAALVGISVAGASLLAQKAPEMKPILAGKKVEPPIRGQAEVDFLQPVTKRNGDIVTTTIKVKNTSTAPIARL